MSSSKVRLRFAPSPTGFLHIGGFRTALYAWLFAKQQGGDFILRVEDTDQERRVDGAISAILEAFEWFGIDIDEGPSAKELQLVEPGIDSRFDFSGDYGPYVQSLRLARYQEVAEELVQKGIAYRCDMTAEQLEAERKEQIARGETPHYSGYSRDRNVAADTTHVIRFRMPDDPAVVLDDIVRGEISWSSIPLHDPILLKSDGFPTYHLAVVIDDHDMEISHVTRGEEWIASAPLHLLLYEALGWEKPKFLHLPVINGEDGKKLSKRHGSTACSSFKEQGYLPEALLNFIARIGWSPSGEASEILSLEELTSLFSLEQINASSGVFEYPKLDWMNGQYIQKLSDDEFLERATPFLGRVPLDKFRPLASLAKERLKKFTDIESDFDFLLPGEIPAELHLIPTKKMSHEEISSLFLDLAQELEAVESFSEAAIEASLKSFMAAKELKPGLVLLPLRIATTGRKDSPSLYPTLAAMGKEDAVLRLRSAAGKIGQLGEAQQPA